jgi:hypothetical protein
VNEYTIDHAVIRKRLKDDSVIVFYPHRTVRPNMCPVIIIRKDGSSEQSHLGILAYNQTIPGNTYPECVNIFHQIPTTRSWRISSELETAIKQGRLPIPTPPDASGTTTQGETP